MIEKPIYRNDKTEFITYTKPLTNKMYYKIKDVTAAIIYVDDNWKMGVDVVAPFAFNTPIFHLSPEWVESKIVSATPRNMERIMEAYNLERYDTVELLYRTRGISYVRDDWFAWSEDDKIIDYHPRFNSALDTSEVVE